MHPGITRFGFIVVGAGRKLSHPIIGNSSPHAIFVEKEGIVAFEAMLLELLSARFDLALNIHLLPIFAMQMPNLSQCDMLRK